MRLTCPNCQTQYEVDASAIPSMGREVQCGNCQEKWFQQPEGHAATDAPNSAADAADTTTENAAIDAEPGHPDTGDATFTEPAAAVPAAMPADAAESEISTAGAEETDRADPVAGDTAIAEPSGLTGNTADGGLSTAVEATAEQSFSDADEASFIDSAAAVPAAMPGDAAQEDLPTADAEAADRADPAAGDAAFTEPAADDTTSPDDTDPGPGLEAASAPDAAPEIDNDLQSPPIAEERPGEASADLQSETPDDGSESAFADDANDADESAHPGAGDNAAPLVDEPAHTDAGAGPAHDAPTPAPQTAAEARAASLHAASIAAASAAAVASALRRAPVQPDAEPVDLQSRIRNMGADLSDEAGRREADQSSIDQLATRIEERVADLAKASPAAIGNQTADDAQTTADIDADPDAPDIDADPDAPDIDAASPAESQATDATAPHSSSPASDELGQDAAHGGEHDPVAEALEHARPEPVEPDAASDPMLEEIASDLVADVPDLAATAEDSAEAIADDTDASVDAIRAALAEDADPASDKDGQTPDEDVADTNGLGTRVAGAGAAAAAAASVVAMPRPEAPDDEATNNLAERLKARVAEAARDRTRSGEAPLAGEGGKILAASDDAIKAANRATDDRRLPDADGLATSLRGGRPGLRATATPMPEKSRFSTGFVTAIAVFVVGLLLYVFAAQIGARMPQLEPGLMAYASSIDGLRASLASVFGNGTVQ